jgi:uncharacterized protein YkwD
VTFAVAVVGALVLAGCYSTGQQQDVDLVNAYRRANNAPAVTPDSAAMAKAQAWSEHMAARNVMEHTGGGSKLNTSGVYGWCSYWENVGYGSSVAAVHAAFRNSPTHRRNMLTPAHRIGTGVYQKGSRVWVTEIYLRNC